MAMSDPLGDMLTRIRNAQRARMSVVSSPASTLRSNVLEVLKREGYIRGYSESQMRAGLHELRIELKYHEGEPVIKEIKRVSKPGRRVYSQIKDLPRVYNGVGYRAAVAAQDLTLQLGYSNDIKYVVPAGVKVVAEKPTLLAVSGADRQKVGQVAAEIRAFRGPEPYKGKGVKYEDETIVRK